MVRVTQALMACERTDISFLFFFFFDGTIMFGNVYAKIIVYS